MNFFELIIKRHCIAGKKWNCYKNGRDERENFQIFAAFCIVNFYFQLFFRKRLFHTFIEFFYFESGL